MTIQLLLLLGQQQTQQASRSHFERNKRLFKHNTLLTLRQVAFLGPRQALQQCNAIHCQAGKLGALGAVTVCLSARLQLSGLLCAGGVAFCCPCGAEEVHFVCWKTEKVTMLSTNKGCTLDS